MNTRIFDGEKNYAAYVIRIPNLQKLDNCDNVVASKIFGSQVIVSKDTAVGDLGVFFPVECQLSEAFLSENNLFRHYEKNKANNPDVKGFFEDNGRVRAVKFRGNVSSGFWVPATYFDSFVKGDTLTEGLEFNELNGIEICRKYVPRGKVKGESNQPKPKLQTQVDVRCFKEHVDTENFFRNIHKLKDDDKISITVKLHGTSFRVSNNIVYRKLGWFTRQLKKLGFSPIEHDYKYVIASRRVIKSINFEGLTDKRHYYNSDIWTRVGQQFESKLHKGETVYGEIIGWENDTRPIQKGYSYGFKQGEYDFYIYRISQTNPDGVAQDLPWSMVKERCTELGFKHVPEVFYGYVYQYLASDVYNTDSPTILKAWREDLEDYIKANLLEKPSMFSNADWNKPEEGVVIQVEKLGIFDYFKAKSHAFLMHETKMLDEEVVALEDEN